MIEEHYEIIGDPQIRQSRSDLTEDQTRGANKQYKEAGFHIRWVKVMVFLPEKQEVGHEA